MKTIWSKYISFHSTQTVQKILLNQYEKINISNPEQKAFENCYPFMYYLMHAKNYFYTAEKSPISVQPTLLFYGLCQLIKASILTVDPSYPAHSNLLAHGVSTRKRKKQNYLFLNDEVKIQKHGLYGHMAHHLFQLSFIEGEKYSMKQLLKRIPEVQGLFRQSFQESTFLPVHQQNQELHINKSYAETYFISSNRLKQLMVEKLELSFITEDKVNLTFKALEKSEIYWHSKLSYNLEESSICIPSHKDQLMVFPEVLVHYLILYNLSMISRYETEWWYDLLYSHSSVDYVFILRFLETSLQKVPYLFYPYFEQLILY
ncbi:YaaC family protein [Bacillus kexueae]|uniref:YaaC family protein n=1 Tax=Aeribacillus kexueae TaxID=2078952 RepID=UPI001FAED500|nr:YaaC family protein [Bacillus kexueae]